MPQAAFGNACDRGLFDAARKRVLPVLPRRIGIVTSADGAALRDILRILTTRHPTANIVIRPARVQGDDAPADLIRALKAIVKVPDVDVVIIGRGGGSSDDLWAFNDEGLARAIAACPVPVVSAVGHEIDFTIADFVADLRAATPSNAAELVVDRADNFCARIRLLLRWRAGCESADGYHSIRDRGTRRSRSCRTLAEGRTRLCRVEGNVNHRNDPIHHGTFESAARRSLKRSRTRIWRSTSRSRFSARHRLSRTANDQLGAATANRGALGARPAQRYSQLAEGDNDRSVVTGRAIRCRPRLRSRPTSRPGSIARRASARPH